MPLNLICVVYCVCIVCVGVCIICLPIVFIFYVPFAASFIQSVLLKPNIFIFLCLIPAAHFAYTYYT